MKRKDPPGTDTATGVPAQKGQAYALPYDRHALASVRHVKHGPHRHRLPGEGTDLVPLSHVLRENRRRLAGQGSTAVPPRLEHDGVCDAGPL